VASGKTLTNKTLLKYLGKPWIHRIFPLPLGLDRTIGSGSSSVIFVTSVLDALALNSNNNVVTLADGAGNLPPEHLPFFENFAQIIFWWDEKFAATFDFSFSNILGGIYQSKWYLKRVCTNGLNSLTTGSDRKDKILTNLEIIGPHSDLGAYVRSSWSEMLLV